MKDESTVSLTINSIGITFKGEGKTLEEAKREVIKQLAKVIDRQLCFNQIENKKL